MGSLAPLFLTTSYSHCFDFTLSKVGDGYIDGTAFLFQILLNLTSPDAATTGGMIKSASLKWSEQMCKCKCANLEVADILPCLGNKFKPFLSVFKDLLVLDGG